MSIPVDVLPRGATEIRTRDRKTLVKTDPNRDPRGGFPRGDPNWATSLVLGAVAVATLLITGSPDGVPVVVGAVVVALRVTPRS
jgi:hypothetical protein